MVISHQFKFIFIKTAKTAGTSIEVFLSGVCDPKDIFTPFSQPEDAHIPRNYQGLFNPIPELITRMKISGHFRGAGFRSTILDFLSKRRFYHHIPGWQIRERIKKRKWEEYFKFCVERNPWDKVVSGWNWYNRKYATRISLDEYLVLLQSRIQAKKSGVGVYPYNYLNYIDPVSGKIIIDHIIQYEHLNESLTNIFTKIGIPFSHSLDIYAKSGFRDDKGRYKETLSKRQQALIEKLFDEEIKLHGYVY
jgi:hypothetical protein